MKIGEVFKYSVDGRIQLIRKERCYYIAYVEDHMCFYQLDEFPFQVLKHTVEGDVNRLLKSAMQQYYLSVAEASSLVNDIQVELADIALLSKKR